MKQASTVNDSGHPGFDSMALKQGHDYIWKQGTYLVLVSTGLDLTDKMFGN